ncbi:MAG: hypothetical protein IJK99_09210 [Bacteroidales bacterium]|nr:hypothetical protein [Bacteroidales bacterium]
MADKNLGEATPVHSLLKTNSIYVEVGGSVRRLTVAEFLDAINEGQTELLHEVAWGIPIKDEIQSSPAWGMVGNLSAYAAYKAQVGRYLMDANGRAAKLHPNNSGVFADGTTLDETKGSVVVIAPRLYFLYVVDAETSIPYLWMSQQPISTHYLANAGNGNYIVVGAYKGSITSGKLVSRSDVNCDTSTKSISGYWGCAQAFGANWGLPNYNVWKWIAMMCLCETNGNANIQAGIGQGVGGSAGIAWDTVNASAVLKLTGKTKGLGDASGAVSISDSAAAADSSHVSVLGVEDFWGLQGEFIQGVFFGNSGNADQDGTEIFIYEGNRMPNATELASHPNGHFRQLVRQTTSNYLYAVLKGEYFDIFAKTVSSSAGSNSRWCDYSYNNNTGQVLLVGGYSNYGAYSGPFYAYSNSAWSLTNSSIGARPAYYGQVQFVDGGSL